MPIHGDSNSRISPRFPSYDAMRERRHKFFEACAARGFLMLAAAFGLGAIFSDREAQCLMTALLFVVAFIAVCFYAGNRQYVRSGSPQGDHDRPF